GVDGASADAKLTDGVRSPAENRGPAHAARIRAAERHRIEVVARGDRGGNESIRLAAVAQLTSTIPAPTVNGSAIIDSTGVGSSALSQACWRRRAGSFDKAGTHGDILPFFRR